MIIIKIAIKAIFLARWLDELETMIILPTKYSLSESENV